MQLPSPLELFPALCPKGTSLNKLHCLTQHTAHVLLARNSPPTPFPSPPDELQGTSLNELQGLTLTCTPSQRLANGQCPVPDGEYTIKQLGLNYLSIGQCAGILISYIVICRCAPFGRVASRWGGARPWRRAQCCAHEEGQGKQCHPPHLRLREEGVDGNEVKQL